MHMYNFLCSDSLYIYFFLLYMVFIHVFVHEVNTDTPSIYRKYYIYILYKVLIITSNIKRNNNNIIVFAYNYGTPRAPRAKRAYFKC